MSNLFNLPKSISNNKGFPWTDSSPTSVYDKKIKYPKITIVTPSYNQGEFLEETIRSVLLQNYPNLEYIIIDGGSTDNSVEIIKKYEKWIDYWVSEPDNGQAHAINKGLKKATGEIFNWLNSDDFYTQSVLEKIGREFFTNNTLQILCGKERYFFNKNTIKYDKTFFSEEVEHTIALHKIAQPSTFIHLKRLNNFYLFPQFHYMFDAEAWIRINLGEVKINIKKTDTLFVNFRLHSTSKTVSQKSNFLYEKTILLSSLSQIYNLDINKYIKLDDFQRENINLLFNQYYSLIKKNSLNVKKFKKYLNKEIFNHLYGNKQYNSARKFLPSLIFKKYNTKMYIKFFSLILPNFILNKIL